MSSKSHCQKRALLVAAATQELTVIRYLIEVIGLHPDDTINGKPTALCYALLKRDHCLMRYLIRQGANINHIDSHGSTPLHYATLSGCADCLSYLLRSGAIADIANNQGKTPLTLSANNKCLKHCRRLLKQYITIPHQSSNQYPKESPWLTYLPGYRILH